MALRTVNKKFGFSHILVFFAIATFLVSMAGLLPANAVEYGYARPIFPTVSHIGGLIADAVPFSWLDFLVMIAVPVLLVCILRKRWRFMAGAIAAGYLVFFWGWGVNYHRDRIEKKLGLGVSEVSAGQVDEFTRMAAGELNRLWPLSANGSTTPAMTAQKAADRVRTVVSRLDSTDWTAASRIKRSYLIGPWFRIAGIDGMFNPIVHEPVVAAGLLSFELPFVMSHELAHVRGYPDEGDANLAALLATVSSEDTRFQYSGWFHIWLYLRTPELDALLADGPRLDLQLYALRIESQQIRWVSNLQTAVLDLFLKANDVDEGVRSYARFVTAAIASRDKWGEFEGRTPE